MTLFEASDRLGGKILTPCFATGVRYEAGAAEFYDYEHFGIDPLKDLVRELGLPIRPMGGPAVVVEGDVIANLDDVRDRLGQRAAEALLEFDRRARDRMTPREFYASGEADSGVAPAAGRFDALLADMACPRARRFVEHLIHSDLAAEPAQTSVEYGLQNYLMNDPAYLRLYGIEGGNERLIEALAARIDATVLLGRRVRRVARTPRGTLLVRSRSGGSEEEREFDAVVVALPHDQVSRIEFTGERLGAAVASHHAHHDHPAHYLRITMLFDRPFWRNRVQDSFWMLDRFGGCCLYDESSRDPGSTHGVLGWLLGGDAARELSASTDAEIAERALGSLPPAIAEGREAPLEVRVHRWTGAVSALPGGVTPMPLDRRHCPEPVDHPNLFLVGDYLYDSTLNGVLDSAEYVAAWIASKVAAAPTGGVTKP